MKIPTKEKTAEQQIAAWRQNIPDLFKGAYRRTYDKAMSGKSLRAAVTAKCQDCMCWQGVEIKRCDIVTCPLHPYRPGVKRAVSSNLARQSASDAVGTERTVLVGCSGA
jgi:hypothetical protein